MKHLLSGKDYTNKTKCIFILYIICDKINQLGKQLQFCKSYWCMVRKGTVDTLLASKDDVLDGVNKARIAKIATAATGLALGGTARGLTVIGLALIPFTFGGSIALSVAGASVGIGSTTAGTLTKFITKLMNNQKLKAAQRYIEFDRQLTANVQAVAIEYEKAVQSYEEAIAHGIEVAVVGARCGIGIARGVAVGAQLVGEGATLGGRVVARVAGGALGGLALAFTAPLDIYHIVLNAYDLSLSHRDESGRYDRDTVCQFLIKQSESMLKGISYI